MPECACGCGKLVKGKWSQGHNRKGVPPTNKIGFSSWHGYRFIYQPSHPAANPTGYVAEHRLIMERLIGRLLVPGEVVHHKDGNRSNNDPLNLELLAKAEHDRIGILISEFCMHPGCGRPHTARGLCGSHYGKYYRRRQKMPLEPSRRNRWTGSSTRGTIQLLTEEG